MLGILANKCDDGYPVPPTLRVGDRWRFRTFNPDGSTRTEDVYTIEDVTENGRTAWVSSRNYPGPTARMERGSFVAFDRIEDDTADWCPGL